MVGGSGAKEGAGADAVDGLGPGDAVAVELLGDDGAVRAGDEVNRNGYGRKGLIVAVAFLPYTREVTFILRQVVADGTEERNPNSTGRQVCLGRFVEVRLRVILHEAVALPEPAQIALGNNAHLTGGGGILLAAARLNAGDLPAIIRPLCIENRDGCRRPVLLQGSGIVSQGLGARQISIRRGDFRPDVKRLAELGRLDRNQLPEGQGLITPPEEVLWVIIPDTQAKAGRLLQLHSAQGVLNTEPDDLGNDNEDETQRTFIHDGERELNF